MTDTLKHVRGMGFDATVMDREEHPDFPCHFHKLGGDTASLPCPEEPFIFVSLSDIEEGVSMCRKHYARFVFDMMESLEAFILEGEVSDSDLPPEEEDGVLGRKDQSIITKGGFYETFMRAKRKQLGAN
jgi:hypothetical protein